MQQIDNVHQCKAWPVITTSKPTFDLTMSGIVCSSIMLLQHNLHMLSSIC